jgi:hypothetical protein
MKTRIFLLSILTCITAVTAALGGQKYRLASSQAAGDVVTTEATLQMDMDMTASSEGIEIPGLKFSMRDREKYTETLLYNRGANDWSVRRVYAIKRGFQVTPDGEQEHQPSGLQGMTVTITRKGNKTTVTPLKGKLSPEDRKELLEDFDSPGQSAEAEFYPREAVAVGEEWTVSPQSLEPFKNATAKCRFEEIVQYAGLRCARVSVEMEGDIEGGEDFPGAIKAKLKGAAYHSLDHHRDVAFHLTGPFTLEGKVEEEGRVIEMRGEGTFRAKWSATWLKVGGKPVQRKP